MTNSNGVRRGTRYMFKRAFRKHGMEHLSTYMRVFKKGQHVHIKGNGAFHKGMPHKSFHGMTGEIISIGRRSVQVAVLKRVHHRLLEKKVILRLEHVMPARYKEGLAKKVQQLRELKKLAAERNVWGVHTSLGIEQPKSGHLIQVNESNKPVDVYPIPYELII